MDGIKLSFEEMVSRLDTACGMLIVAAMSDRNVRDAMEVVTSVSLSLGEWGQDYENDGEEACSTQTQTLSYAFRESEGRSLAKIRCLR